jgi:putative membrane protein
MKTTRHAVITGICLSAALVACGDRDTAYDDTAGMRLDSAAGTAALTQEYTESELLGLIGLANEGTIELAKLAQRKATSPDVKALAGKAVQGHTELGKKAMDLAAQLNLTPIVPSADESLAENQRKWMDELNEEKAGKDWDKDYLEYEINRHETVLDEVKDALSREQRPEVRAFLEEVRTHIEGHIPAYKDVVKKLEG